jgi:hypothetical protein
MDSVHGSVPLNYRFGLGKVLDPTLFFSGAQDAILKRIFTSILIHFNKFSLLGYGRMTDPDFYKKILTDHGKLVF